MTLNARAMMTRAAAALWLAVTLFVTQRVFGWMTPVPFWSVFTATMAGMDFVQNIVLFLPMGWIARRAGWSVWRTVLVGALVSAVIEVGQIWAAGRTSTATDICCNTAGAALGWWMAASAASTGVARGRFTPRLARLGINFIALAGFMSLHVLNTMWPSPPTRADADGAWTSMYRVSCPEPARSSTICLDVPNTAQEGKKYVRIVGANDETYVVVQSQAIGRPLTRSDCVPLKFEHTVASTLKLRPPERVVCALADSTDSTFVLRVDPRLEHEARGEWTPTRAGEFMWPVWPFTAYRPTVLRIAGAMTFIMLAALLTGAAPWVIPAGYLVMLELVALVAGMRGPGWLELVWAAVAWMVAVGAVAADRWWRGPKLTA